MSWLSAAAIVRLRTASVRPRSIGAGPGFYFVSIRDGVDMFDE